MKKLSIDDFPGEIEKLEEELKPLRPNLLEKFKTRVQAVEDLRWVGVAITVVGAATAAFSRSVQGDWGLGLAIGGVVGSAVAGLFVAAMDRKKLEISGEATSALANSDRSLEIAKQASATLNALDKISKDFDRKRRERLFALERMLTSIEASLISPNVSVKDAADHLLASAIHQVRAAVSYNGGDFFTVTIFQKQSVNGDEQMIRIAAEWTDPLLAEEGGRSWSLGKGFTGVAWNNAKTNPNGDVVISDTLKPEIASQYPVANRDPERERLYRSVAAIPILIRSSNEVWGVVTATTDQAGVFERDPENIKVQNVDVIRDIAKVAALLASLENGKP